MVKLYIVEDEMLLRELIKSAIDYQSIGIEIVGEADNSITALEQIRELEPDIVFMDIRIPYINGLKLSAMLKELYPWLRIIIITGYSEFEYARQAISIGVSDYICKPVDSSNLRSIIIRMREEILQQRRTQKTLDGLIKQDVNARLAQRTQYLTELVTGECRDKQELINTQFAYLGLSFNAIQVCSVVMELKTPFMENRKTCNEAITNWMCSQCEEKNFISFWVYPYLVLLLDGDKTKSIDFQGLAFLVQDQLNTSCRIAVGSIEKHYSGISVSYRNALKILEDYFDFEQKPVIYWKDLDASSSILSIRSSKLSSLAIALSNQDISEIHKTLDEIMNPAIGRFVKKSHLNNLLSAIINVALEHIISCGFSVELLERIPHDSDSILAFSSSITDVKNAVYNLYAKVIECIQSCRTDMNAIVIKARLYIQNHYMEQISLGDIARACDVSPAYLSKQFKQKTSQNIVNYIEELRLSKARALIDEYPEISLGEVCATVGYVDQYYFSKRFKTKYGFSPRRYIEDRLSRRIE